MIKTGDKIQFIQFISVDGFSTMAIPIKGNILDIQSENDRKSGKKVCKVEIDQKHLKNSVKQIRKINKNSMIIPKSSWNIGRFDGKIACVYLDQLRKDTPKGNELMKSLINDINSKSLIRAEEVLNSISTIHGKYESWI